jgi:hypothetical protein
MNQTDMSLSIYQTTDHLSASDLWDHFLARVGCRRNYHRIKPGLYTLGKPNPNSPVFVTANYTLSFDALRSALKGISGYILVLNTQGINVWCAAGKGSFGTEEIVHRVEATKLLEVVNHRKLILPQLGAPGVIAHEVKKRTGFLVEYGPIRASDLPEFLKNHKATQEMRRMQFTLRDRLVLIPVDLMRLILPVLLIMTSLYFIDGLKSALALLTIILVGVSLFPILLPWIPTSNFSTKGFLLGVIAALPFAISTFISQPTWTVYRQVGQALGFLLVMPAAIAFIALNFTGSTTFTSRSGVKREIFTYIPIMAWAFGIGIILNLLSRFIK